MATSVELHFFILCGIHPEYRFQTELSSYAGNFCHVLPATWERIGKTVQSTLTGTNFLPFVKEPTTVCYGIIGELIS